MYGSCVLSAPVTAAASRPPSARTTIGPLRNSAGCPQVDQIGRRERPRLAGSVEASFQLCIDARELGREWLAVNRHGQRRLGGSPIKHRN